MVKTIEGAQLLTPDLSTAETTPWIDEYRTRGYVKLDRVFDRAEMDEVRAEFDRLFDDSSILCADSLRSASRRSLTEGSVLDRLDPVIDLSPVLRELTQDARIVSAASAAIGAPARLFKDKAIMKPPGAFGYSVHQDFTNWQELPVPPQLLISALVAIDAADAVNGALQLYPGLHHHHLRAPEKPSDIFNPQAGLVPDEALTGVEPELMEAQPGDLILFSSLAPHFSGPNRSSQKRRTLFLSYNAASYGDVYGLYYENFYSYLRKDREQM